MLLIVGGIAYGITAAVSRSAGPSAVMALGTVVGLIGYGVAALVVSGALAALIGIEEAQRRASERTDIDGQS
ncbi:MAG TPA: hypothetical protein VFQ95_08190 [Rhodanobacteraceae bacterium]|nr:hypothetical protein [Rhodanobacteraceae bacterium]